MVELLRVEGGAIVIMPFVTGLWKPRAFSSDMSKNPFTYLRRSIDNIFTDTGELAKSISEEKVSERIHKELDIILNKIKTVSGMLSGAESDYQILINGIVEEMDSVFGQIDGESDSDGLQFKLERDFIIDGKRMD